MKGVESCLVLAPHFDDAELGCGATIARLIREGAQVKVMVFCEQRKVAPIHDAPLHEGYRAAGVLGYELLNYAGWEGPSWSSTMKFKGFFSRHLGESRQEVLDAMIEVADDNRFDLVIAPSLTQTHQDHEVVAQEAFRAFKYTSLLGFDAVWNNLDSGRLTTFVEVTPEDLEKKVAAVACYESQMPRPYFERDVIFSLARTRGLQCGVQYAEAFETYRRISRI
jgi:LmbE family N-acetylglucosaminyl deacetylase